MKKAVAAVILLILGAPLLIAFGAGGAAGSGWCPPGGGDLTDLDGEQSQHARTIVTVGDALSVPERGLVVALATAAQESMLRNLPNGDRDSVGLFQQRAAWGTFTERTHPPTAATFFFTGGAGGQPGLLDIDGWEDMSITDAAQAVQRSAYTNPPSGHVAVYLGDGLVISNDVLDARSGRRGGVYIVEATELTDGVWNLPYVGWAPPVY